MTVSKLDPKTRQPRPFGTRGKRQFFGVLGAGAIGVAVTFDQNGIDIGAAGVGSPVNCDVISSADLTDTDFIGARFVFFAQKKPSIGVDSFGIGVGNNFSDTVFSITLATRQPPVTLETVMLARPQRDALWVLA